MSKPEGNSKLEIRNRFKGTSLKGSKLRALPFQSFPAFGDSCLFRIVRLRRLNGASFGFRILPFIDYAADRTCAARPLCKGSERATPYRCLRVTAAHRFTTESCSAPASVAEPAL